MPEVNHQLSDGVAYIRHDHPDIPQSDWLRLPVIDSAANPEPAETTEPATTTLTVTCTMPVGMNRREQREWERRRRKRTRRGTA